MHQRVQVHGATHVHSLELLVANILVDSIADHLDEDDELHLERRYLAQDSAKSDHHSTGSEIASDYRDDVNFDHVPGLSISMEHLVPEAVVNESPLDCHGGKQEVESHSRESVPLEEGHQEAETDEDHHMDVLELTVVE